MSLTATQKWEMRVVQLVINSVFNDVLENWCPSGHLIRLIVDTLFTLDLPDFLAIAVNDDVASHQSQVGDHIAVLIGNLSMLNQFGEVLLGDAIFGLNVQKDNSILSLMVKLSSNKMGTMLRIWSRIFSPSASSPIAKSCSTLHSLSTWL